MKGLPGRWRAVIVAAALLAVVFGSFFGTRTLVQSQQPPSPTPTPTPKPLAQIKEEHNKAVREDRAKPRPPAELGDFLLDSRGEGGSPHYSCSVPPAGGEHDYAGLESSELYFKIAGLGLDGVGRCDKLVVNIRVGGRGTVAGRFYFTTPKVRFYTTAPAERLQLTALGGRPALLELPVTGAVTSYAKVLVIQRFPGEAGPGTPGIGVSSWVINDLEKAKALAAQIMGGPR